MDIKAIVGNVILIKLITTNADVPRTIFYKQQCILDQIRGQMTADCEQTHTHTCIYYIVVVCICYFSVVFWSGTAQAVKGAPPGEPRWGPAGGNVMARAASI